MKKLIPAILVLVLAGSCKTGNRAPDVSKIPVELTLLRFEEDFFGIDTNKVSAELMRLQKSYPVFLGDFVENILGIARDDSFAFRDFAIRKFIADYRPIMDSGKILFRDLSGMLNETKSAFRYVRHYFPEYKLPGQLITFIGPLDAFAEGQTAGYGDIITSGALGVGLQLHMGADFSYYTHEAGQALYPTYISRRFTPATMTVNCMKNIVDDIFPPSPHKTLLDAMIDKGKRLYLLEKFMPETPDTLLIGYTAAQLKGAESNEGLIWNFFNENNLLYETDFQRIRPYISEGPVTNELGEGSPGYIGLFTGRQIVRAYMQKNPATSLNDLLALDAATLLRGSGYKPR